MLSDKGAIHSEVVQTIIGVISKSKEPLHECLNDVLKELCNEDMFNELIANPDFSLEPILESLTNFLVPSSNLCLKNLENYANFYAFLSEKLDHLSQGGQIALINSITGCISYCYDRLDQNLIQENELENFKQISSKISSSYKNVFKLSLKCYSKTNLAAFAERCKSARYPEIALICREYLKENDLSEKYADYNLVFLKLFVTTLPNHENITSGWISCLQIFTRRLMKFPKHPDILNGLGLVLKTISIIRARTTILAPQITKFTGDLYQFLCLHHDIVDNLITNNLFYGLDLDFFRSVKFESNVNLYDSLKKSVQNCILTRKGCLLVENADGINFLEIYTKLVFGDYSEFESQNLSVIDDDDLLTYELFSKLAPQNSTDRAIDHLLKLWAQSYFVSDMRYQSRFINLLKLSLLSQTSEGLGEIFKRSINLSGPFTVSCLCLLSCFPFSLWRSLEKSSIIPNIASDLLIIWKYLTTNESSIDLLALILGALSNLLNEAIDIVKKEDMKHMITLLPTTLLVLRNNTSMNQIMKHKLAVSMHKLLRSLLALRDDKVLDIMDYITKLGSAESCYSLFDSWKSLGLFALVKHIRDTSRLNKTVSDRIEMLIPKLFSFSERYSNGPKLLVQHIYRHALYFYMRYTQDVNFFNNPIIQGESEEILNYIQDTSQAWCKGAFDWTAEENTWSQLYSYIASIDDVSESPLSTVPILISSLLKPSFSLSSILNLLKDDLISLQRSIENSKSRNDDTELKRLHNGLQNLLRH